MSKKLGIALLTITTCIATQSIQAAPSPEQICRAGIATSDGKHPGEITSQRSKSSTIAVQYKRKDGKTAKYLCQPAGNEIKWRNAKGANTGWANNLRLHFTATDSQITVTQTILGEEVARETFDLQNL